MSICSTASPRPAVGAAGLDEPPIRLVSIQTAAEQNESCVKTLRRMGERDKEFPQIIRINSRDFLDAIAWENYKRLLLRRGLGRRAAS